MNNKNHAPNDKTEETQNSDPDSSLERLRNILFRRQITKMEELETGLDIMEHQLNDEGFLVKMVAPVLGDAIRLRIHEARDEMVEALHPIIGQVVQRAVAEAIADLARSLDTQMKRTFNFRLTWWRIMARLGGASKAQIRLRELLPFSVTDILLIHRETGLLLFHQPSSLSKTSDTDLFSGMLTAIRDFSRDTLGDNDQTGLGEIAYGDQHILIETAQYSYLAVIINGIAPAGFRGMMRDRLLEIEHTHAKELRTYQGDSQSLEPVKETLIPLMTRESPQGLRPTQKRFLFGALGIFIVVVIAACLFTRWIWQAGHAAPAAIPTTIQATSTFTITPSASPTMPQNSPTTTFTPLPSATQTITPLIGVSLGNVWVFTEPSGNSAHIGAVITQGEKVEILAQYGEWVRVRQVSPGQSEVIGWVPIQWVGITTSIPTQIITPTPNP